MRIDSELVVLACVIGATIVAASGNDGWGWLIFVAILAL